MSDGVEAAGLQSSAENHSVAVGNLHVGGSVGGDLTIAHTIGYTSEQVAALLTQIQTTFQRKPFDGRCPYKGLEVFREEDADLFFGREKWVGNLLERVRAARVLFLTGQSGSGKSSLVRAGLIPALRKSIFAENWLYASMKPGRDPIDALATAFSRLKDPSLGKYLRENAATDSALHECAESALSERSDQRLVLFIDQFEEVFTQSGREQAQLFINLLSCAASERGRVILLFAMRSDFIAHCAAYPRLNALLNEQFAQIGAMDSDELVSAIAQPALRVGLQIDPDLIAQIINDMKGEPGALPLMQFALKDLFDSAQAKGGLVALKRSDYLQHGGIDQALERHADASLALLSDEEKELARNVFSALIAIGRSAQDTRRTALRNELIPTGARAEAVNAVVQKLASARLITTDAKTITISHEKLIDAWPWLRKLVNENRESIALQNEIAEHAHQWKLQGQDSSYLYTGSRLATAREKLETRKLSLNELAQDFLNASIQIEEARQQDEQARRQKELDSAHQLAISAQAQARAERRGRLVTIGMLVAALLLVGRLSYDPVRRGILKQNAMPSRMVYLEAGSYLLGDKQAEAFPDEYLPPGPYSLPAFYIDVEPVTNERYLNCIWAGECSRPNSLRVDYEPQDLGGNPIVHITAIDAAEFCNWLGMRLPSDQEWEAAASMNRIRLPAFQPETLEVFFEWTRSPYVQSAADWTDALKDPPDALAKKGGGLSQSLAQIMSYRQGTDATRSSDNTGFRCVKNDQRP